VLDEGTAQIDMEGETRLFAALEAARPGLTMLIVTHRPETAARCDGRIHIADDGSVVASGSENDLRIEAIG
jgi:ABC-type bacteriocin/lantibiotic exporter with double-glycine peptidase domain